MPLSHSLRYPVVPEGKHLVSEILRQLQQTKPLSNSIRRDTMPFSELFPSKVASHELLLQLHGNHQGVTESFPRFYDWAIRTGFCNSVNMGDSGSRNFQFGVPADTIPIAI